MPTGSDDEPEPNWHRTRAVGLALSDKLLLYVNVVALRTYVCQLCFSLTALECSGRPRVACERAHEEAVRTWCEPSAGTGARRVWRLWSLLICLRMWNFAISYCMNGRTRYVHIRVGIVKNFLFSCFVCF